MDADGRKAPPADPLMRGPHAASQLGERGGVSISEIPCFGARIDVDPAVVRVSEKSKIGDQMHSMRLTSCRLDKLRQQMIEGRFAVPKLQRAFVWDGKKAAKLLDSIYRQMPIGPITLWDTNSKNRGLLRQDAHVIPGFKNIHPQIAFVLDGQQRMSVIHKVAIGGKQLIGRKRIVDFDRVVFRVTAGDMEPRFAYRRALEGHWIPVSQVLGSAWKSHCEGLTSGQSNRVEVCRRLINRYQVPLIRVRSESLEEVRELFLRINSLGTPLASADKAFARASAFDLRKEAEFAAAALPPEFGSLSNEVLLQTRALLDGINDVGDKSLAAVATNWDKKIALGEETVQSFTKEWALQIKSINRALDFLKSQFCVIDAGVLPSRYMVATLTCFFQSQKKQPTGVQIAEIRKWFWGTAIGKRYSGRGFRTNILKDVSFFQRLATRRTEKFRMDELADPGEIIRARYGLRSSVGDAICCLLMKHGPCYLQNGEKIQFSGSASATNRKHLHHIFPRKLLSLKGVPLTLSNSMVNICYIAATENSEFGSKSPARYLEEYRGRRNFAAIMGKHLVPHNATSGIWDSNIPKGYRSFLKQRSQLLCRALTREAGGMKLFRAL